jgi:hypothetical protein
VHLSVTEAVMSRRPDPARIAEAKRAGVRARLVDNGVRDSDVDAWLDAWAQDNDTQAWIQAHDWIVRQVAHRRQPPSQDPQAPQVDPVRTAVAMRLVTRLRLLGDGMAEEDVDRWLAVWELDHAGERLAVLWEGAYEEIHGEVAVGRKPPG